MRQTYPKGPCCRWAKGRLLIFAHQERIGVLGPPIEDVDRKDEECFEQGGDERVADRLGDDREEIAGAAGHDQHGDEGQGGGHGRADHGQHHFRCTVDDRLASRLAHLHVAEGVLHDNHSHRPR